MGIVDFESEIINNIKKYNIPLEILDVDKRKIEKFLDAYYSSLQYLEDFVTKVILKIPLIQPKDRFAVVRDIFLRMYILIKSTVKLNDIKDFQTIASITRTCFELYIDLILIINKVIEDDIEKYGFYNNIAKLKYAQKIVHHYQNKIDVKKEKDLQSDFIDKNTDSVENKIINLWKKERNPKGKLVYPDHWSDLNVKDRAKLIDNKITKFCDLEDLYIEIFPVLSWNIHSDPTVLSDISIYNINMGIIYSYVHLYEIFCSSCLEYSTFVGVDKAFENFEVFKKNTELAPTYFQIKKYIKNNVSKL